MARDRGGGYALATQKALPNAVQVADRWHLMENASHAFLDAVRKSMRQIRSAIGAATINPVLLTAAEKLQYEGYLRREETNAAILAMAKEGATIKEIVRSAGYSRGWVRKVYRSQRSDAFRIRNSSLEAYLSLARRTMGGGPVQRLRAMALPEAARVSRMPSRRQRMERATTAIGKDGCKCDQPRALRANRCPVDDGRARPTLQSGDRNRGRNRERSRISR